MSRTNEIVTENLKRWMDASENLKTQAALARAARVGQSYVSRILRGEANPTVSLLESIARAFRRKPIDLLAATDTAYPTVQPIPPPWRRSRRPTNASCCKATATLRRKCGKSCSTRREDPQKDCKCSPSPDQTASEIDIDPCVAGHGYLVLRAEFSISINCGATYYERS